MTDGKENQSGNVLPFRRPPLFPTPAGQDYLRAILIYGSMDAMIVSEAMAKARTREIGRKVVYLDRSRPEQQTDSGPDVA